jgi:methylated-DNA-[protein]-cysteine S-methyltransferase
MRYAIMDTPVGPLTLASSKKGLSSLEFGTKVPPDGVVDESANGPFVHQLYQYFDRNRTVFDIPLDISGTEFQLAVWRALIQIPYGETRSYGDIAKSIGKPGAARAVGMANHNNPIAVVIPCHRVVGHNGSLTGYAGGLELKQKLLSIERRTLFT